MMDDLALNKFKIPLNSCFEDVDELGVVTSYKHMGSVLHTSGSMALEIQNRCSAFMQSYSKLSKRVFRNNMFSKEHRISLMHSRLMSRLLYNIGSAHKLTHRNIVKLSTYYLKACRDIANMHNLEGGEVKYTDIHVQSHLNLPSIHTLIRCARL